MLSWLRTAIYDVRGGVSIIAALAVPVVIGTVGLAFDLNRGYEQREINQRAADMAALGAAMAFRTSSQDAILQPTARDIGRVNGVPANAITAQVVDNQPAVGDRSVRVRVTTAVPFTFARILGLRGSYSVRAESLATLATVAQFAAPCYLALSNAANALTVSGGATIDAPTCSVAAVGSVDNQGSLIRGHDIIAGGGSITNNWGTLDAQTLRYATSFSNPAWNTAVPTADKRKSQATTLVDPWANDATLISARALIGTYTAVPGLTNPTTAKAGAADWNLNYSPVAPYNAWWNSSTKTYTVPAGTYYIKKLTVGGGITVNFAHGSKVYIDGGFDNGGSAFNFGNSDVYVNGGFKSGSSGVVFGDGALWIGSGTVSFTGNNTKGTGDVQINAMTTLGGGSKFIMGTGYHYFAGLDLGGGGSIAVGDGNFISTAGVKIAGDSELSLGAGNVLIGPMSGGNAISLSGSARFFMGDGTFSANGHIDTAGGSKLVFGKTANHLINGNMKIAGAALFGAGRYTINGNFINGTGGTTWPYTSALSGKSYGSTLEGVSVSGFDMAGVNVTFILNGTLNLAGGAKTKLIAPTASVAGAQIAEMLVDSLTSANTTWGAGASSLFSGAIHLPNSAVSMTGGNATLSAGQCFSLVASRIAVTGGAATGTACPKMSDSASTGGGSTTIKLVR